MTVYNRLKRRLLKWLSLRSQGLLCVFTTFLLIWPFILPFMALAAEGAVWTTDSTGAVQNENFYLGLTVYLRGSGMNANATVYYQINRVGGGQPIPVKSGTIVTDPSGAFVVSILTPSEYAPYITDPRNEFQVEVFSDAEHRHKISGDNFAVNRVYALEVDKRDSVDPIAIGEDTVYTITVTNKSNTVLTNVTVTDNFPDGLTFVSSNPPSLTSTPTLTWNFASLQPGQSEVITITAKGRLAGTHTNEVIAGAAELSSSVSALQQTTVNGEASPPPGDTTETVPPGDTTETVPPGDTTETVPPGDTTETPPPPETTQTQPPTTDTPPADSTETVPPEDTTSTIPPQDETQTAPPETTNTVPPDTTETLPPETSETLPPLTQNASATISKSDSVDPLTVGNETVYTIKVTNTGDTTLTNVLVSDELPDGLSYVSSSPGATFTIPVLIWAIDDLAPGATFNINVVASGATAGLWINKASVYAQELLEPVHTTEPTTVLGSSEIPFEPPVVAPSTYELSLTKADDVDPAYVGQTVVYTVTVKNTGSETLTDLVFNDLLPEGLEYKSSDVNVVQDTNGNLKWQLTALKPNESKRFHIETIAKKSGDWTNTVSVTAENVLGPIKAYEKTKVIAAIVEAVNVSRNSSNNPGETVNGQLPYTGFPLTLWWLVAIITVTGGMLMEFKIRQLEKQNKH